MAVALLDVAAAARDCSRARAPSGRAHRLITASQCSRRSALLASVSTVTMSQLASDPSEAAAAELPLVPKVPLTADMDISQVVKGCWQLSGAHHGDRDSDRTGGEAAVRDFAAFQAAGITTLDVADHYGPGEEVIGQYLRQDPDAADVQVLTKACIWGNNLYQAGKGKIIEQEYVDVSRRRLGRPTLDLLQFYWHDYSIKNYVDAALRLTDMQVNGSKIRHIGVTNFDMLRLEEMLSAGVPIVSNQVQYSLLDRRPENGMRQFCADRGIKLLPYGVVSGGLLSDKYLGMPAAQVLLNTASKGKYAQVLGQIGGYAWLQRLLAVLHSIAESHGASIADVATRWVLDKPAVGAVIVGARNASHVADHQRLFTIELSEKDSEQIEEVLEQARRPKGDCYSWERGGTF